MKVEQQVLAWLAQQDADIYMVGGSVRDRLLRRETYDLDLAAAGDGLVLARRLADRFQGAYYPLDEARSTGRAILPDEEKHSLTVDVAQFRGNDLFADLNARDFTINALASHVRALDEVVDRHGGLDDLDAGLIRPVSEESIRDDPLRALRAVRLAAGLDFVLAAETLLLIRRDGAALGRISGERIRDELARLLSLSRSVSSLAELDTLGLLTVIFPDLESLRGVAQPPPHYLDVLVHSLETVRALEAILGLLSFEAGAATNGQGRMTGHEERPEERWRTKVDGRNTANTPAPDLNIQLEELAPYAERLQVHVGQRLGEGRPRSVTLKLAALLHDTGKPATERVDEDGRIRFIGHETRSVGITSEALRRLRLNRAEVRLGSAIVRYHMRPLLLAAQGRVSSRAVYRFFRDTGEAGVDVLLHALADHLATFWPGAKDEHWPRLVSLTARMLADFYDRPAERVDPPLLLDGNDLLRLFGLEPGPQIGILLEAVREAQVSGEVKTREQALSLVRFQLAG